MTACVRLDRSLDESNGGGQTLKIERNARIVKLAGLVLLVAANVLVVRADESAGDRLERIFREAPSQARIRTYAWHWINGHVTTEGITADLENMARAGFAGAVIYHGGNRKGDVKAKPFIPEVGPVTLRGGVIQEMK